MRRVVVVGIAYSEKVFSSKGELASGGNTKAPFCALQGTGHKGAFACRSHIREMRFKLVGNPREIRINRFGVDVRGLESDIKGKCPLCRFDVDVVEPAEGKVRVECRRITIVCGTIDSHAQIDGELSV